MKRDVGPAVSGSPIDLAAMRDAQDQHAQDVVLDARHDAPAPPTRYRHSGAAPVPAVRRSGAPRLRGSSTMARRSRS